MFIKALFIIAKIWKQPKVLNQETKLTNEQIIPCLHFKQQTGCLPSRLSLVYKPLMTIKHDIVEQWCGICFCS